MKAVKAFLGSDLTRFILPPQRGDDCTQEMVDRSEILQELSNSTPSLRALDLGLFGDANGRKSRELSMKCVELTSLSLKLNYQFAHPFERTQEEKILPPLQVSEQDRLNRKAKLKKLYLRGGNYQIDWPSFLKWMGQGELADLIHL